MAPFIYEASLLVEGEAKAECNIQLDTRSFCLSGASEKILLEQLFFVTKRYV